MSRESQTLFRFAGVLAVAAAVAVLVGTYCVSWLSVSNGYAVFGATTLFRLHSLIGGRWNAFASAVMSLGAVVILGSGALAIATVGSRARGTTCSLGLAVGAAIVVTTTLVTSFPTFPHSYGAHFVRDAGQWLCVIGGAGGLAACAVTLVALRAPASLGPPPVTPAHLEDVTP